MRRGEFLRVYNSVGSTGVDPEKLIIEKVKSKVEALGFGKTTETQSQEPETLSGSIRDTSSSTTIIIPDDDEEEDDDDEEEDDSEDGKKKKSTKKKKDEMTMPAEDTKAVTAVGESQQAVAPQIDLTPLLEKFEALAAKLEAQQSEAATKEAALKAEINAKEVAVKEAEAKAKEVLESMETHLAELRATKEQLGEATKIAKAIEGLDKLNGKSSAEIEAKPLTVLGAGSQEMRNYEHMIESTTLSGKYAYSDNYGRVIQRDTRELDAYFKKNKEAIRGGVEAILKEAGWLGGKVSPQVSKDSLVLSQIPSTAIEYLSSVIRTSSWNDLILRQFVDIHSIPGVAPRRIGEIPRYPYSPRPTSVASRTLTPGTALATTARNVTEDLVSITVQELGLGKDTDNPPLGISEFVEAMSLASLENIVRRNLARDYETFKDLWIQTTMFTANTIVYNDNGQVTTTAGDIATGDNGTWTRSFMTNLYAWMRTQQIPTYSDGCYMLVVNMTAAAQILTNLTENERYMTSQASMASVASMLSESTQNQGLGGEVDGYIGKVDNFHVFQQNSFGVQGGVTDPGTNDVTFGSGVSTKTTLSSFAFGSNTMAWATAMPVEIRTDNAATFGRLDRLIWLSHEAHTALDLNSSGATERRMVQVRNLITPV